MEKKTQLSCFLEKIMFSYYEITNYCEISQQFNQFNEPSCSKLLISSTL